MIRSVSGVYSSNFSNEEEINEVKMMAEDFLENEGRRPRISLLKWAKTDMTAGQK